jgi:DUF1009 family protein
MKIGLIAGGGDLPLYVCQNEKIAAVVGFKDMTNDEIHHCGCPLLWTSLGKVGAMVSFFKSHRITHIMMIGNIKRPSFAELKVDYKGAKWLIRLRSAFLKGDDELLRAIADIIESEGFSMIPAPKTVPITSCNLEIIDTITQQDINHGDMILKTLSAFDIGQSIIVEHGIVLGIEAAEGTDHLIQRCKDLKKIKGAGVLIKRNKQHQHDFLDTPTIGPTTIDLAYTCGLKGISIDINTNIVHSVEVQSKIRELNMFLHIF